MEPAATEILAAICLLCTLLHSLLAPKLARFSHLLSEVEFIFGFWALLYLLLRIPIGGFGPTLSLVSGLHFSEALFVALAMVTASTRPVLEAARVLIEGFVKFLPFPGRHRSGRLPLLFGILVLAPLSGSLITEPAAMTVGALLIHKRILGDRPSKRLLYSLLATLFVNVSIGGVLTAFAAPPVLVVARLWDWDTAHMLQNFGWKAALAVTLNAAWACFLNREELAALEVGEGERKRGRISNPILLFLSTAFLVAFIRFLSSPLSLLFLLALFAPYLWLTREEQGDPKPVQGLLVGFFLAGLLVLTSEQGWWLAPLLERMSGATLFVGASFLTGITDNAALTSLAAQVQGLSENARYLVVAGAVTGGGLTLIANAPNPAGFAILKHHFEGGALHSGKLLTYALLPTLIAGGLLWIH
jgi:hypothetical protein